MEPRHAWLPLRCMCVPTNGGYLRLRYGRVCSLIFSHVWPSRVRQVPPVAQHPPAPNAMRPSTATTEPSSWRNDCRWQSVKNG
ncbi:hypothetical protein D9M71_839330 [compost metagenome]